MLMSRFGAALSRHICLFYRILGVSRSDMQLCSMYQQRMRCNQLYFLMSCYSNSYSQVELCKAEQAGAGTHWNAGRPHASSSAHR